MQNFNGQNVLITGATRGIGKASAKLFINKGATVFVTGTTDKCPEVIKQELGGEFEYIKADFSDESGIKDFLERIDDISNIDVCVNNAGINRLYEIESIPNEDYDEVLSVNLHAPFKICRYVAKRMKSYEYGRVINVASIWSVISKPKRTIYTISKNALIGLTKTMAIELAPYDIMVNAISPGFTMTELTKSTLSNNEIEELATQIPINRFASPKEIGKVILFLASKDNTYMTGQNIVVDGGFTNV